jgi:hypothetical protein
MSRVRSDLLGKFVEPDLPSIDCLTDDRGDVAGVDVLIK